MSLISSDTKIKLRDMGAADLLEALESQDDHLVMGMGFEQRIDLAVDVAHTNFVNSKIKGLISRAGLRYPDADLRRVDNIEQRGINRNTLVTLASGSFIVNHDNLVFQGFTGSGKTYLGCAAAKLACQQRYRAYYIRMPDLEELWENAKNKPQGTSKFLTKFAGYTLLVIDEWLLNKPDETIRAMLLELLERRYDCASTVFCTQYAKKDWHERLGGGVHADAIMDRVVHNAIWVDTGEYNMREFTAQS